MGNYGIQFTEMEAGSIIKMLREIETDPQVIWENFSKYFKRGFFYTQIESELGITPETHAKLTTRLDQKLAEIKEEAYSQLASL